MKETLNEIIRWTLFMSMMLILPVSLLYLIWNEPGLLPLLMRLICWLSIFGPIWLYIELLVAIRNYQRLQVQQEFLLNHISISGIPAFIVGITVK